MVPDRRVAIVGVGVTKQGFYPEKTWKDMVAEAYLDALKDARMDPAEIQTGVISITCPEAIEQENIGPLAADYLGLLPIGFSQVVSACAGGAVGLRFGVLAILSGIYDRILVTGVEKVSEVTANVDIMQVNVDSDYDYPFGIHYVDLFGLTAARYLQKYKAKPEYFAQWAVQDRWYALRNPKAIDYGRQMLNLDDIKNSTWITEPIHATEASKMCDGSAAVLLVPAKDAKRYTDTPVYIDGVSVKSGVNYVGAKFGYPGFEQWDASESSATMAAGKEAYELAGVTPDDVNMAQVHDCFPINGILQLEALGILPIGKGAEAVARGATAVGGRCPTCTDGGRISFGHPTGATGLNMVVETVLQMRGAAGERQVAHPDVCVCETTGGMNAAVAVTVLRR